MIAAILFFVFVVLLVPVLRHRDPDQELKDFEHHLMGRYLERTQGRKP